MTIRNFRITTDNDWGIYCSNGDYTNIVIDVGAVRPMNTKVKMACVCVMLACSIENKKTCPAVGQVFLF